MSGQTISKYEIYCADLETSSEWEINWCWAWCIANVFDKKPKFGSCIESLFEQFKKMSVRQPTVYFHNMKFDGSYILDYICKNKWKSIKKEEKFTEANTFKTLISGDGMHYEIQLCFAVYGKRRCTVKIWDSFKIIASAVGQIGKDLKLPVQKGKLDYNKVRYPGHEITEDEKNYLLKDVLVMCYAMEEMIKSGLDRMTLASSVMAKFKEQEEKFDKKFPPPVIPKPGEKDDRKTQWDSLVRQAYRAGICQVHPAKKGIEQGHGFVLDYNSLYPYICSDQKFLLPYGIPVYQKGKLKETEAYPLYVQHFICCFQLKKGKIPCFQDKNSGRFVSVEYLENSIDENGDDFPVSITMTNIDLKIFLDHYTIWDEEWIDGYLFHGQSGALKEFYDPLMKMKIKAKEEGDAVSTLLAKLQMNALTGKWALNPITISKFPYWDYEHEFVKFSSNPIEYTEEGKPIVKRGDPLREYRKPIYVAMSVFICSWAHVLVWDIVDNFTDIWNYTDTDSFHFSCEELPEKLKEKIDPVRLGALDLELEFEKAKYLHAKTYIEYEKKENYSYEKREKEGEEVTYYNYRNKPFKDGENWHETERENLHLHVTACGMPEGVKKYVTWENFKIGTVYPGKLASKRGRGGIALKETTFTLRG